MSPAGPTANTLGRTQRALIWLLCRALPAGFRARQRAEWTGDLMAISAGGAGGSSRYLFAAAWTLPALRAHVRKAGMDLAPVAIRPANAVTTLVRVMILGLGFSTVSWLIMVPARYLLLDIPGRYAQAANGRYLSFGPDEVWPGNGPFADLTPLWIALNLGTWAALIGSLLLACMGLLTGVVGATQRGAGWIHRSVSSLLGIALAAIAVSDVYHNTGLALLIGLDKGLTTAALGGTAVLVGLAARGLTRRNRIALIVVGLAAVAVLVTHRTALGEAMFQWYMD